MHKQNLGTIYAVDIDAPEMNDIERMFRMRDLRVEMGQVPIILPEDEHKKYQKDGTIPKSSLVENIYTIGGVPKLNMNGLIVNNGAGRHMSGNSRHAKTDENLLDITNGDGTHSALNISFNGGLTNRYCICGK